MFTKLKLYLALTLLTCALGFTGYWAISLGIQKRQLTETIAKAQTDLAKELQFSEVVMGKLSASDIENSRLRKDV